MIDQHFVELQLLNSAAVVDRSKMNGKSTAVEDKPKMNGNSTAVGDKKKMNGNSAAVEDEPKMNGNSAAVDRTKMNGNSAAVPEKKKKKKIWGRRHGCCGHSSDVDLLSTSKEDLLSKSQRPRRPSDIDSLSPEVLKALQSTFGGKLDEIRSKRQAPPPTPPSPPPSPPPPLSPLPSPSLTKTAPVPAVPEKRTFLERLADRDGACMLIAYFSAVFLSGFIYLAADGNDSKGDGQDDACGGGVDSNCARLFGYILPVGLSATFLTFALIFCVFDVSFGLFNILTTADSLYIEKKNRSKEKSRDDFVRPSAARLALHLGINVGFVITPSALLWISKTSILDPLYTICEQRLQMLWMLGLMIMVVVILLSAIKSFRDPPVSEIYIQTAARTASMVFCVLLLSTAVYNRVTEPKTVRRCVRAPTAMPKEHRIQLYGNRECEEYCNESFQRCGRRTTGLDLYQDSDPCPGTDYQQCSSWQEPDMLQQCAWPQRKAPSSHCNCEEFRRLEWCKSSYAQQCEWPRAKRIQPYVERERCWLHVFPQCDWPLVKQIQPYEDKDRCQTLMLVHCDWPWVKQIQLYEHEERCEELILEKCDWPLLKQIQQFEGRDRCPLENPHACQWPWMKQIELYESSKDSTSQPTCPWMQQPKVPSSRCTRRGHQENTRSMTSLDIVPAKDMRSTAGWFPWRSFCFLRS